jgi:lysyl-tRNA synthetase class 2
MDLELLQTRAKIIRVVRAFFDGLDYLELDTPLLAPDLIPESCLEVFQTEYKRPGGKSQPYWLIPSPEIWMKRVIARHKVSVYQVCKCFRNGESTGYLHSPEFTMLEYYTMNADYRDSLKITEDLFAYIIQKLSQPVSYNMSHVTCITMNEAFKKWAGFDLFDAVERQMLPEKARGLGLDPPADMGTAALYDLIFVHAVEPSLPKDQAVALIDYPAFVPCLARANDDNRTVQRWELYINGVELANCYSEEQDPAKVRAFFESEAREKAQSALVPHKVDANYWKYFLPRRSGENGFPRCSGAAMGLDRLIMALTGRSSIDSVLPFPM